jgi:hypothetical protein
MTAPCRVRVKVPDQGHGSQVKQSTGPEPMEVADGVENVSVL